MIKRKITSLENVIIEKGINPVDDKTYVLDFKEILDGLQESYKHSFTYSPSRNTMGCCRFPSLIFDSKESSREEIADDIKELFSSHISVAKGLRKDYLLLAWNRNSKDKQDTTGIVYDEIDVSDIRNFIKIDIRNKDIFTEKFIEGQRNIDSKLKDITIKGSGKYPVFSLCCKKSAIHSYTTLSVKPTQKESQYLRLENPDNEYVPLLGCVFCNDNNNTGTAEFKESCTCLAFELFKGYTKTTLPRYFDEDEMMKLYNEKIKNIDFSMFDEDVVKNLMDIHSIGKAQLLNGVSQILSIYKILLDNNLNPEDFVCTRKPFYVEEVKNIICSDEKVNVSTTIRDKVNPYDVIIIEKKALGTKDVQKKIAKYIIDNSIFLKTLEKDDIKINKNNEFVCIPVSLKETIAILGKGTSYFLNGLEGRVPDRMLKGLSQEDKEKLFDESSFTYDKEISKELMNQFCFYNIRKSNFDKKLYESLCRNKEYEELFKKIFIYGLHKKTTDNKFLFINSITSEQYNNVCKVYGIRKNEHVNWYGLNDYRYLLYYKILDTTEVDGGSGFCNNAKVLFSYECKNFHSISTVDDDIKEMMKLNSHDLFHKLSTFAYMSLIIGFTEKEFKKFISFSIGRSFGQSFLFSHAYVNRDIAYRAITIIENKSFVGNSDEEWKHNMDYYMNNISFNAKSTPALICDNAGKKECSIRRIPISLYDGKPMFINITFQSGKSNAAVSITPTK